MKSKIYFAQVCRLGGSGGGGLEVSATLRGHSACVRALAWHPVEPALLISGAEDQTVRLCLESTCPAVGVSHGE